MNLVCHMHSRLFLLTLALLLLGCASMTTVQLKPTDTIRNSTTTESSEVVFQERKKASTRNPYLEIEVVRQAAREESFQRRYIEKRVARLRTHLGLWFGGILVGSLGYLVYEQGYVVLGRDLIGLGLIVPLGGAAVASKELGEQWKPEIRKLSPQSKPALNLPVSVSVRGSSWIENTNDEGLLKFDIADLADMAEPGGSLTINLQSKEDTTQKGSFTVEPSIVAYYRTPPVSRITAVEPAPSVATIAILDFQGIGVSAQEAQVLTNRLGTQMVQLGTYHVIERGQMEQILQEQDFQLTGCTTNECAVEIGQLIGAQQMLAGSFGKLGTVYTIDMKIIDVETGRILRSTSYDIEGSINRLLSEGLAEAVRRIANTD